MLCESRKENLVGGQWAALGVVGGSGPGALAGLLTYHAKNVISAVDLLQVVVFAIGAALAITFAILANGRGRLGRDLRGSIRARTARAVGA